MTREQNPIEQLERANAELKNAILTLAHTFLLEFFGTRIRAACWLGLYLVIYFIVCYFRP